ncbi:LytR C-terminal domain-containing protein [Oryzihumus leptocrescens]|uniref:LytR cell envelope-related transcriptional attenuator n=1 Tax=Oryzihumus leptocrescens TaxID=297536 RepID=A0A542Z9Q5_9MICO|nr:LytR C-terminal domain-containing protein [Oryzihumus leptocrescens]TQL57021.1 LytR cell envelope-related transcriptional attenuator [Oryzihumus leptocrescens]
MTDLDEADVALPRRRGRRRAAITLTVVALLLVGAFACAGAWFEGWVGDHPAKPAAAPACPATPSSTLTPADVTVNVYNTTSHKGLAGETASRLRDLGYLVATVSNDPLHQVVAGTAVVRYGPSGAEAARVASSLVRGATLHRDGRPDSSVDLVIGAKFTGLSNTAAATATAGC